MKNSVDNVVHSAMRSIGEQLNCIYFPYNGHFEWMLKSTTMKLHCPKDSLVHEWPCNNWPENTNWLPGGIEFIPNRIDIDAIIVNWRKDQSLKAEKIADIFHLPLIIIDHELPSEESNTNLRKYVNSRMPKKAVFVSVSNVVNDEWKYNKEMEVVQIPYGFSVPEAITKENDVLVVGDYHADDTELLNEMLNSHPNTKCLGYNGHGVPYKTLDEITIEMAKSKICITASESTCPPFLAMTAAAAGCAVVTNQTRWTKCIFEHNDTVMFFDSVKDIKKHIRTLITNKSKLDDMAMKGKQIIIDNYSIEKFRQNWINFMADISTRIYTR